MRFSGDIVDVTAAEAERLLSIGAIDSIALDDGDQLAAGADLPAVTSSPESGAPVVAVQRDAGTTGVLERPRSAAAKSIWEDYAAARGVDVAGLGKDEIIAAVDALDQQ